MMKEKMTLETERAELLLANRTNCDKLGTELTAWRKKTTDDRKRVNDWWVGLSDGAKDELIEKHRAEWDKQSLAMVGAAGCVDAMKAAVAAAD